MVGKILENAGYRVVLQQWDFANRNFMEAMQAALDSGARVIALLSPAYFKSDHCMAEALNTIGHDPLNKNRRLIMMRIAECAPSGLFTALAYWDLVSLRDNASRLREIVLQAVDRNTPRIAPSSFFTTPKTVLHDRIREVPNFTGRREDLALLDRALWADKTAVITQAAVQGLGGVGKSTLAIQYAWENRERYAGAWWLGADTAAGIVDGLVALGATFIPGLNDAKDRAEAARTALNFIADGGFAKPWLLLYDNVEQPKALDGLLPRTGTQVLITTRWPDWKGRAAAVALGVLAPDEAVQFLLDRTDRTDKEGATRLAVDLGHLPLALDHAAAYCKRTGTSFDRYRELLPELIKRAPKDANYPRSVYATFSLAIEHAAAECAEAEMLMGILAYFAPDDIPLSLITAEVMNEIARGDAVAALYEVSLLEIENEGDETTVSVHRLAQTVMRDRLAKQGQAHKAAALALTLVADSFPHGEIDPKDVRSWPVCAALRPHAISVLQELPDNSLSAETSSRLLNQLAGYLESRAEYVEAEALYRRALSTAKQAYGPDHLVVGMLLGNLAGLLLSTDRIDEGESLRRRELEIMATALPPEHPHIAKAVSNLAMLLKDTKQFEEAEPLMRRALEIDEKSFGKDHPTVAISLNNLAMLLKDTKQFEEAEPLMRRALEIDENIFGEDHPEVARDLNNLATLLREIDRLDEAVPLMRRALKIDEKAYGSDHPRVALDFNNLSLLLLQSGRFAEAEPLLRHALDVFTASLGTNHPRTKTAAENHRLLLGAIEAAKGW